MATRLNSEVLKEYGGGHVNLADGIKVGDLNHGHGHPAQQEEIPEVPSPNFYKVSSKPPKDNREQKGGNRYPYLDQFKRRNAIGKKGLSHHTGRRPHDGRGHDAQVAFNGTGNHGEPPFSTHELSRPYGKDPSTFRREQVIADNIFHFSQSVHPGNIHYATSIVMSNTLWRQGKHVDRDGEFEDYFFVSIH
ncbi:MAG: hypothetical protein U5R49_05730 [Deltaproteobacteria bacterium]|nr:hypothetical protein [Deltaproteobacteria bacterium]